jgi:filamentous hemagglutinin family protein
MTFPRHSIYILTMNIKQPFKWTTLIILLSINTIGMAQITTDGTLGPVQSLSGPDYQIGPDLGQQHGGNLFHSFQAFNLQSFESATFSGPNTIQNVISRVTGGNPSSIDGTLRSSIPGADFYFLNPNGIIFGSNARLDIQGSFYASTANYLTLEDSGRFSATHPENSLLTIAPIRAFGFLEAPATITIEGSKLEVPEQQNLSLVGGDIFISNALLKALNGTIRLNSLGGAGEVNLDFETTPFDNNGGEIQLSQQMDINPKETMNANQIFIRAGQFVLQDEVIIQNRGNRPAITLEANRITMTGSENNNAIEISSRTKQGSGGTINIIAMESFKIYGQTLIHAPGYKTDQNAGQISITTNDLQLADDATIDVRTLASQGHGNGGKITIKTNNLSMIDETAIRGNIANSGQGGNIHIVADRIYLADRSAIASITAGDGEGGNITLDTNSLFLFGQATITTDTTSQGTAGRIDVQADHFVITDSAQITSDALGNNIYVRKIKDMAEFAIRLGAKPSGDFTGGGKAGQVCINQIGANCENDNIADALTQRLREKLQLQDCPGENTDFVIKNRSGLPSLPDELIP